MSDAVALALFEDDAAERFLPLTWTRPVFDLRCGIDRLGESVQRAYGVQVAALHVRPLLADIVRERTGLPVNEPVRDTRSVLLVNGRVLAEDDLASLVPRSAGPRAYRSPSGDLVAAVLPADAAGAGWRNRVADLESTTVDVPLLQRPWQLFTLAASRVAAQAARFRLGECQAPTGVHLVEPGAIHLAATARVQPGVVLDATAGPIVIDEFAVVMANAVIQGPTYVGPYSQIKIGAKIYHGTSIGPWCKVGGEVEESVFQGYTNKQHDGFLGHAVLGEWCNLGANTNNSDLKNNYGSVRVWHEGDWYDTGEQFVGLLMGDHSKTGINTSLNTGTVVGVSCNLFGGGLPPKHVPSFGWGGADGLSTYRVEDAVRTARRVMARRAVEMTAAEEALLREVFDRTAPERD